MSSHRDVLFTAKTQANVTPRLGTCVAELHASRGNAHRPLRCSAGATNPAHALPPWRRESRKTLPDLPCTVASCQYPVSRVATLAVPNRKRQKGAGRQMETATGNWLLGTGYWELITGNWLLETVQGRSGRLKPPCAVGRDDGGVVCSSGTPERRQHRSATPSYKASRVPWDTHDFRPNSGHLRGCCVSDELAEGRQGGTGGQGRVSAVLSALTPDQEVVEE